MSLTIGLTFTAFGVDEVMVPDASVESGTYDTPQAVELETETENATIYYTTDGSTPTTRSTEYGGGWFFSGVEVNRNMTLKAIAVKDGVASEVSTYKYTIRVAKPEVSPSAGRYKDLPEVELSCSTPGSTTIYYTLDGSEPTTASKKYTGAIVLDEPTTIKAIAVKEGSPNSFVTEFKYTRDPDMAVLTGEESISAVIEEMTLEEKIKLVQGVGWGTSLGSAGSTFEIPRLHIPSIALADGPTGAGTRESFSTAFPNTLMRGSTWNKSLLKKAAGQVAKEAKFYGYDWILAPAMDIHRDPRGGRTFEYYSEDPYLTGKLAASYVKGMQEHGVGATLKHYAANNAENNRQQRNNIISEQTLNEIYLPHWRIAVQESQPWGVMSAYNKVNGTYCTANEYLNRKLKEDFGFNGVLMSDWGAYHSPVAYARGFDLNMPGRDDQGLKEAVENGTIGEQDLDRAVSNVLHVVVKSQAFKNQNYDKSKFEARAGGPLSPDLKQAGKNQATKVAEEGIVLLKNSSHTLPLSRQVDTVGVAGESTIPEFKNISVQGAFGGSPSKGIIVEGAGSAQVELKEDEVVSLVEGIRNTELNVLHKNSEGRYLTEGLTEKEAQYMVANSDVGIVQISRPGAEGADVPKSAIEVHEDELELIKKLSKAYHSEDKQLIVLLNVGHPMAIDSMDQYADAIMYIGLPGTYGANAVGKALTGAINPSGKLVDSWPKKYSDLPTSDNMPTPDQTELTYSEGLNVGYRYYDRADADPMYPFGYGLSYTTFDYRNLQVDPQDPQISGKGEKAIVRLDVTNTGDRKGKEVVQLYLHDNKAKIDLPFKELRGFAKTKLLNPGETQTITFTLDKQDFSYFDPKTGAPDDGEWVLEPGAFTIYVGGTSNTETLTQKGLVTSLKVK